MDGIEQRVRLIPIEWLTIDYCSFNWINQRVPWLETGTVTGHDGLLDVIKIKGVRRHPISLCRIFQQLNVGRVEGPRKNGDGSESSSAVTI